MGHEREYSSPAVLCEFCGSAMAPILGAPISGISIYREVLGYRCPSETDHEWRWLRTDEYQRVSWWPTAGEQNVECETCGAHPTRLADAGAAGYFAFCDDHAPARTDADNG